jgi:hypothetical protein
LILLILVVNWSCTSRVFISGENLSSGVNSREEIVARTIANNISLDSYFIERGDILIKRNNSTERFLFTVKFERPDKYLFSIKSTTGLEGGRIYMTKDTVIVNDRINKRILYGKPQNIERITGLPFYFFNMAFGDLIIQKENSNVKNEIFNNKTVMVQNSANIVIRSVLDSKTDKVSSTVLTDQMSREEISLKYSKFSKEIKHIPEYIEIQDHTRNLEARIRIRKVKMHWDGIIEFVPGQGYKKEEIK